MKKWIIILLATMFVFVSCDSTSNAEKSKQKTKDAEASFSDSLEVLKGMSSSSADSNGEGGEDKWENPEEIDKIDFTASYDLFNEAVEADSNNLDAQLGASITRILSLLQDENFRLLKNSWWKANDINLSSASLNANRLKVANFVNNSLKPALAYSLERLEAIDTDANKDYFYTITPEFYGEDEGDEFQLDMTEIKLFHALLIGADAAIDLFNSYNTEISDYSIEGIKTALTKGSEFLKLKDATKVLSAHSKVNKGINKGIEALEFLLREVDNQDDDIIRNTHKDRDEINEAKDTLNEIKNMLNDSYTIEGRVDMIMDIKAFVTNPVSDLKELLPNYIVTIKGNGLKVEAEADNELELVFPDPTFGGLFPSVTQDEIKLMMDIYECTTTVSCEYSDETHCDENFQCADGGPCSSNTECYDWEHCGEQGFCEEGSVTCSLDSECEDYQTCSEGYCIYK